MLYELCVCRKYSVHFKIIPQRSVKLCYINLCIEFPLCIILRHFWSSVPNVEGGWVKGGKSGEENKVWVVLEGLSHRTVRVYYVFSVI